jgi:transcriptional regulator with XRE-family HTH domain
MMTSSKLGEILKSLRKAADLSQAELAERSRIDPNTLSLAERGKRPLHDNTLEKICDEIGATASVVKFLSDETDDPDLVRLQKAALRILLRRVKLAKKQVTSAHD